MTMGKRNADHSKLKTPQSGDKVSLRQFAALVGVDYVSAREALENGRIQFMPGTRLLDWDSASQSWQETRDHKLLATDALSEEDADKIKNMTPLGKAKLRKESASAYLKEIELSIMQGKYLLADDVTDAVFKFARTVRDSVMSLPERIGAEVASKIRESVNVSLLKELDEDLARKCMKRFSEAEAERVVREAWIKESRDVLSSIDKLPRIKNEKVA